MTEREWLTSTPPRAMLAFLHQHSSDRKFRLLGCAFCRRVWHLLTDERSRQAIEVAERFADDDTARNELEPCRRAAQAAVRFEVGKSYPSSYQRNMVRWATEAAAGVANKKASSAIESVLVGTAQASAEHDALYIGAPQGRAAVVRQQKLQSETDAQRILLRDIYSIPFRLVAIDPAWLAWRDATIPKLAQAAYDERSLPSGELDRVRLAILADALEEAGCTNGEMVAHLRSSGPHVRGCWVVDLLLGKE